MFTVCRDCGRNYEIWQSDADNPYHYTESGLPNIGLIGVTVYSCPNCELESAEIPDVDGLHDLISKDIILKPLPMTGAQMRFLRKETQLRPKEFAERLGVDPKTIGNWEGAEKLSRQSDVTVRVFVSAELWKEAELYEVLSRLMEIAKYSWEGETHEDAGDLGDLVEDNVVYYQQHHWDFAPPIAA